MATDKILLITGSDLRHHYFVYHLNHHFSLAGVFFEILQYPSPPALSNSEQAAWQWFFNRRDTYEQQIFSSAKFLKPKNRPGTFHVPEGALNTPKWDSEIARLDPDLIVLFGGSLIGDKILNQYPDRILNLHLGITGEYRGSSCNFWPIHDSRLECLGATLITINQGIDTGEILAQGTIKIEESDDEQTLMGKTIILGVEITIDLIKNMQVGALPQLSLKKDGALFLRKDFSPEAILKVKTLVENQELKKLIRNQIGP